MQNVAGFEKGKIVGGTDEVIDGRFAMFRCVFQKMACCFNGDELM